MISVMTLPFKAHELKGNISSSGHKATAAATPDGRFLNLSMCCFVVIRRAGGREGEKHRPSFYSLLFLTLQVNN